MRPKPASTLVLSFFSALVSKNSCAQEDEDLPPLSFLYWAKEGPWVQYPQDGRMVGGSTKEKGGGPRGEKSCDPLMCVRRTSDEWKEDDGRSLSIELKN